MHTAYFLYVKFKVTQYPLLLDHTVQVVALKKCHHHNYAVTSFSFETSMYI